uniref:Retrotransposon protein, putative, unclassified n=2 Tax=Oryza sativa subsp. japonica TaxID=39947 RepID=Q53Q98_ORYSJ|nr:retrotransposon protein, putative, unclassified [Oryza sativa Japonica Group]ABA92609.1 retrotransposon protein, putative, unclassified [Oryza sativa Japonica Group]
MVCCLNKSLYGLNQAPRAWYSRFANFLLTLGFTEACFDTSLFIYTRGSDVVYILLYVDDIVLTASSDSLLRWTIAALQAEFSMKDLGTLDHFLGISVCRTSASMYLSQRQYILDILDRAGMSDCKPCSTPVDTNAKLSAVDGDSVADPTDFRSLAGALQYLTFTDLTSHMLSSRSVSTCMTHGSRTLPLSSAFFVDLVAYSDADWAGCPNMRRSTSGYVVFLGDNLVSWSSKHQNTLSRSSAKAKYRAVAETCWLRQLLNELHSPPSKATVVYCDNVNAVYLFTNPEQHQRTKHVEIDLHFVRDRVDAGVVRVLHVPTTSQYADIFTKGLPSSVFS